MLHLKSRVHLQKVKVPLLVHQKLDGSRILVIDGTRHAQCRFPHPEPEGVVHDRAGAFLHNLLVPPLQGAFPFPEKDCVPVPIRQDLNLDVTRARDVLLQIHRRIAEGALRFRARRFEGQGQAVLRLHKAHPFAAPSRRGFHHHRVADPPRNLPGFLDGLQGFEGSGDNSHAGLNEEAAGLGLVSHAAHRSGRRADQNDSRVRTRLRKAGIFGKESVAGMDGFGPAAFCRVQDPLHRQVTLGRRRRPDEIRLVRQPDMQRGAVGFGVDRHGRDPQLPAGSYDADRDFSAVGNEHLAKHFRVTNDE